jgi:hypothetical protein
VHDWRRVHRTAGASLWECTKCFSKARAGEDSRPDAHRRRDPSPWADYPYSAYLVEKPDGLTCEELTVLSIMES